MGFVKETYFVDGYEADITVDTQENLDHLKGILKHSPTYLADVEGDVLLTTDAWRKQCAEGDHGRVPNRGLFVFVDGTVIQDLRTYSDGTTYTRLDGRIPTEELVALLSRELKDLARRAAEGDDQTPGYRSESR